MSRSSARRGQVSPLAALAAVLAVSLAVAAYAGAFAAVPQPGTDRNRARPALDRVLAATAPGGVVAPGRLGNASVEPPAGYRLAVTLRAGDRSWHTGPRAPESASRATRPVPVRTANGTVAGRLVVEVWPRA